MSDPNPSVMALAQATQLAESVREMNHATILTDEFFDPAEVYRLVGELTLMAHRLPQLFTQLERITRRIMHDVDVDIDEGTQFESSHDALAETACWLDGAKGAAITLAGQLDAAQQSISAVYATVCDTGLDDEMVRL